jgi:hypothetical protein
VGWFGLAALLPSTILGAPTPLLTRLTLDSVARTGRVVGRIQAGAALGSVLGTFLTGVFLISWFGTRHIVAGVAAVLLVLDGGTITVAEIDPAVTSIARELLGLRPSGRLRVLSEDARVALRSPPAGTRFVVSQASLDRVGAGGHSVVLTDDHAPVDQLLAPVFAQSLGRR